ncbi:MAG: hypothetical protein Q9191_006321, partial [Dirinaria sp. TL-2023a]
MKAITRKLTEAIKASLPQNKRKNTPPPPTPVQLPTINLRNFSSTPKLTADELFKIIASFPRYGPKPEHAKALGINLTTNTALEDLVPSPHLPPSSWLLEPIPAAASSTFPADSSTKPAEHLGNGKAVPDQVLFWTRLQELLHDNDLAFRFLDRQLLQTDQKVNIASFRKFWENLQQMAGYWDTSKDEYDPPSPGANGKQAYTGNRVGNGANMPAKYREDAIQQFVHPVCWEFDCKVGKPFFESKLQVRSMDVPASCSGVVYRYPLEKEKRRAGKVQGPLLGVSARNAVKFRQEGESLGEGKLECLDVVREVGLALNLAQKRGREGKVEQKTWVGKWWAEKLRWGGGEGGDIGILEDGPRGKNGGPSKERLRQAQRYKKLTPPTNDWDPNVEYMQIGKPKHHGHGEEEDIYLVSSVAHHLSILRVRVPAPYLDFITNGPPPPAPAGGGGGKDETFIPADQPWFRLDVRRSKWFDLLKPEGRAQAMR